MANLAHLVPMLSLAHLVPMLSLAHLVPMLSRALGSYVELAHLVPMRDLASTALIDHVERKKMRFPRVTSHTDGKDRGKKMACLQACRGEKEEKGEEKIKKKEGEGETRLKWYLAYRIMSLI